MAAMAGAEFRRRDACRARGPEISTIGGARAVGRWRSSGEEAGGDDGRTGGEVVEG